MKTSIPLLVSWLAFGSLIQASELPQNWISTPPLLFSADRKWQTHDGVPFTGVLKTELHDVHRRTGAPIGDARFTKIFNIKDGLEDGEATFLNSEGRVVERIWYKDGKKDGSGEILTPAFGSATCRTQYHQGLMHGKSEGFSETGGIEWMVLFKNGIPASFQYKGEVVLVGQENVRRRDDGLLYVADSLVPFSGAIVEFYINGRLKSFGEYKAGLQDGVGAGWHPSGAIYVYHEFRHGKMHGASLRWNGFDETRDLDSFHFILDGKVITGHAPFQTKVENEK